jgi:hypothetical protein
MDPKQANELGKSLHIQFVDSMHKEFSWKRPSYAEVITLPLIHDGRTALRKGSRRRSVIFLNENLSYDRFILASSHESAHFLHKMVYRLSIRANLEGHLNERYKSLSENIAELASLIFIEKYYNHLINTIQKYSCKDFPIASKLFQNHPKLEALSVMDLQEAEEYILNITREYI